MSDYVSKSEAIHTVTKVELKDGTFAEVKMGIGELPSLDETEIIRKYGEQILDAFYGKHAEYRRLSEQANIELPQECYYSGHTKGFEEAIKIVKEECGISE